MIENNHEVLEAIQELATQVDKRFDVVHKEMGELRGEVGELRGDMGKLRSDMIDYVGRTVESAKGEIIDTIKTDRERQKMFNVKILAMLERGKIAKPEEAAALRQLTA